MTSYSLLPIILLFVFGVQSISYAKDNDPALAQLFKQHKIDGQLIIESLDGSTTFFHQKENQHQRFIPASTFKIPHTLIALQEGTINRNTEFKWDGTQRSYDKWNANQSLTSAFQYSCVWRYEGLTQHLTATTYQTYLKHFAYGNAQSGQPHRRFWLEGDLAISLREQIDFLKKVYLEALPIDKTHFATLKEIMKIEDNPDYQLHAKSGWLFANHLTIHQTKALSLRKQIVMEALRLKRLIP